MLPTRTHHFAHSYRPPMHHRSCRRRRPALFSPSSPASRSNGQWSRRAGTRSVQSWSARPQWQGEEGAAGRPLLLSGTSPLLRPHRYAPCGAGRGARPICLCLAPSYGRPTATRAAGRWHGMAGSRGSRGPGSRQDGDAMTNRRSKATS
jgi:hypothetical protein